MFLRRRLGILVGAMLATHAGAQDRGVDVDFLINYYDQDGQHSPVTGGLGTEDLQVVSPVVLVKWAVGEDWTLSTDLGFDSITSASTDNIDTELSSASRQDARAYTFLNASRQRGDQSWSFGVGLSNEYDYQSLSGRIGWSLDLDRRNTNLSVRLSHYSDNVELYDIDGVVQGEEDRQTTDLSLALTRVLGKRTVGTVELSYSVQSGFLSTPFHEVILAGGERVTERLPDSRERLAVAFSLNHAFSDKVIQRIYYRFYDDDFGVAAHTVEAETHFRLPSSKEIWIYPILRFHSQEGSDYFGLPGAFEGGEPYFTADRDLSGFDSEKFGLGMRMVMDLEYRGLLGRLKTLETRWTNYSRDDGLDALSASLALGWRF